MLKLWYLKKILILSFYCPQDFIYLFWFFRFGKWIWKREICSQMWRLFFWLNWGSTSQIWTISKLRLKELVLVILMQLLAMSSWKLEWLMPWWYVTLHMFAHKIIMLFIVCFRLAGFSLLIKFYCIEEELVMILVSWDIPRKSLFSSLTRQCGYCVIFFVFVFCWLKCRKDIYCALVFTLISPFVMLDSCSNNIFIYAVWSISMI